MKLICINCPLGCNLEVNEVDGEFVVSGNTCPRGENYAVAEMTNPTRILTTTVKINGSTIKRLPVITTKPIPKTMVFDILKEISNLVIEAPINMNDVIVKDVLGTNVDIIASRSLKKIEK